MPIVYKEKEYCWCSLLALKDLEYSQNNVIDKYFNVMLSQKEKRGRSCYKSRFARLTVDNITILSPNHRSKPPPSTSTSTERIIPEEILEPIANQCSAPLSRASAQSRKSKPYPRESPSRKPKNTSCSSCNCNYSPNLRTY